MFTFIFQINDNMKESNLDDSEKLEQTTIVATNKSRNHIIAKEHKYNHDFYKYIII